jgi:hypothetical protein
LCYFLGRKVFFDGGMFQDVKNFEEPNRRATFEDILAQVEIPRPAHAFRNRKYTVDPANSVPTHPFILKALSVFELVGNKKLLFAVMQLLFAFDTNTSEREQLTFDGRKTIVIDREKIAEEGTLPNWPVGVTTTDLNYYERTVAVKVIAHLIRSDKAQDLVNLIQDQFLNSLVDGGRQLVLELIRELDSTDGNLSWKKIARECLTEVFRCSKNSPLLDYYLSVALRHGELKTEDLKKILDSAPVVGKMGRFVTTPNYLRALKQRLNEFIGLDSANIEIFKEARKCVITDPDAQVGALCLVLDCGHFDERLDLSEDNLRSLLGHKSGRVRLATY